MLVIAEKGIGTTVTDTLTGRVRTYQNQAGQLASVADTAAF